MDSSRRSTQKQHESPAMRAYLFCNEAEVSLRQEQCDIHVLEATDDSRHGPVSHRIADPHRVVHRFYRSGSENLQSIDEVRSLDDLHATATYLLSSIWKQAVIHDPMLLSSSSAASSSKHKHVNIPVCYAFIMDRLAAVRQDLTMYYLPTARTQQPHVPSSSSASSSSSSWRHICLSILISILRFYAHSDYIITCYRDHISDTHDDTSSSADADASWYDASLHRKAFSAALSSALDLINDHHGADMMMADEIYAYYLLGNQLDLLQGSYASSSCMSQVLTRLSVSNNHFPQGLRHHDIMSHDLHMYPILKLAWMMIIALRRGNTSRAMKLIQRACASYMPSYVGVICMMLQFLPEVRIMRMLLMNRSANKESYPITLLSERLSLPLSTSPSTSRCILLCSRLKMKIHQDNNNINIILNDAEIGNDPSYEEAWRHRTSFISSTFISDEQESIIMSADLVHRYES